MKTILAFFKAPLNQAALAGMVGTAAAVLGGQITWQAALPVIAGAVVAIIIPDNSVAKEDVAQLVADAVKAAAALSATPAKAAPTATSKST
ncbi:MAG TPA: hypothetical protein VMF05_10605 [Stellaceae bacterium]|nr:hypothetical protein [Stellaceae bacterium]